MDEAVNFDLKLSKVPLDDINRGDLVFKDGAIWMCASKATSTFVNMENRDKLSISDASIPKLNKLELVPVKWEVIDDKVSLEGRELGMGATHKLSISWLRAFD